MAELPRNSESPKSLMDQLREKYPGMNEPFAAAREFKNVDQMREWYAEFLQEIKQDRIINDASKENEHPTRSDPHAVWMHVEPSAEEDALEYILMAIYHNNPFPSDWEEWYKAIPTLEDYRKARVAGSLKAAAEAAAEDAAVADDEDDKES